jgi:hypothetical protein
MGPVSTSETSVKFYQTIRRVIFILAAVRIWNLTKSVTG